MAAYMLLVWLLGLASGIVNACVVQSDLRDVAQVSRAAAHGGHDHASVPADVSAVHSHQAEHAKPPCERLCDGPPVAPQADQQQLNPLNGLWLAAAVPAFFHFEVLADSRESSPRPGARSRTTVPIAIAFGRLTL